MLGEKATPQEGDVRVTEASEIAALMQPAARANGRGRIRPDAPSLFDALREEIIALRLKPGMMLSRQELQRHFGLSSTPVRDALLRLRDEGLVDIFPQHATRVSLIDVELAEQEQFHRRALETECVRRLAALPQPALIGQLVSVIRQQKVFDQLGELEAFSLADQNFHRALYVAAGVEDLWYLMRSRSGHIDRIRRLHLPVKGKTRRVIRDHEAIAGAIAAGDVVAAERAVREHLAHSLATIDALRIQQPDYFRP